MLTPTTGFTDYCPPVNKSGETLLTYVDIYKQCTGALDTASLILSIAPADMVGGGQGLTESMTRQNTTVTTAASETASLYLFGGLEFKYSIQLQRNAASKAIDEILEGVEYVDSISRPGYESMVFANRVGDTVPTYTTVFRTMSGSIEKYIDVIWNCQVMTTAQAGRGSATIYNKTIEFMSLPINDEIGSHVERFRKK